jgi:O-acetyl-ADP-ribose deacetylase (regulator of RNase III)
MPTVVIAPNTFTVGNFPKDIVLPTFIEMFNQYKFTNDEFLTDIRFVAATDDDFLQLLTTAERTLGKSLRTPVQEEPVQTEASVERKEPQSFSLLSSLGSVASSVSSKFPSPWSFFQSRPTVSPRQAESVAISLGANCTLTVKLGNIVDEDAVAIVSPSNSQLEPTTAISAAIFDASCGNVQKDSLASMRRRGGPVLTGRVAVTEAGGKLLCKNIIHVVAPKRDQFTVERCQELLKYAVKNILECAEGRQIPSIALPPLFPDRSTVPTDQAVQHLIDAILHYPHNPNSSLKDIRIIISDENMLQPFLDQAQRVVHSMESLLSGATTPPPQNPPPTSPKPEVPQKAPSGVPSPRSESNIMEIPLGKSNRRLTIRQQHFLYENTDIKIAAICSEMGFTKGINKNLNNALKGLLQETVDRRYTNGKPGKFDVFTVHCPPATANCRFLVVANILDRNLGEQEDHRFLQQILHSVFKEADTLEMPSVAIAPHTFRVGGFVDSVLSTFIKVFNQYHFTNDEFLTDVRFLAPTSSMVEQLIFEAEQFTDKQLSILL